MFGTHAPAHALTLSDDTRDVALGSQLMLLEDKSGHLGIDEVRARDGEFTVSPKAVPSFGFSASAHWARIELTHEVHRDQLWLLELAYAPLQHIDVYLVEDGQLVLHQQGGSAIPVGDRLFLHRTHVFPLSLRGEEHGTLYVRIAGESSLSFPLTLWRSDAFAQSSSLNMYMLGAYVGVMVALMLYNLFIFITVRETSYAMYIFFMLGMAILTAAINGTAQLYLWPNSPGWAIRALPFSLGFAGLFASLFTSSFLRASEHSKRILAVMRISALMGITAMILALTIDYKVAMILSIAFVAFWITGWITSSIIMIKRGNSSARYYLTAWIMLFLGSVIYVMKTFGLVSVNLFTEFGFQIGSAMEAILLSVALAARMRALREENAAAQIRIAAQEKMANLGLLSAGIAHEINNPNNFISLSAQTLEARLGEFRQMLDEMVEDDEELRTAFRERFEGFAQQLTLVKEGSQRIGGIVKGMRGNSRNDAAAERTAFDPVDIIHNTLMLVKPSYKAITFDTSGLGTAVTVNGHASQLAQVFTNLLVNACHAIEERNTGRDGKIWLRSELEGTRVRISITDNGCGMSDDVRKRLFEPFFTTKGAEKGTGLGMGICKGIIERHGGTLEVQSTVGEGTTMSVVLPAQNVS